MKLLQEQQVRACATGVPPLALKAFRFRYDETLEKILAGEHRLLINNPAGPFEAGRHVSKVQQALVDAGFPLPTHGVDGRYGQETADAVAAFKTSQRIFPNDGVVGVNTMRTLDVIFADEPQFIPPAPQLGDLSIDELIEAVDGTETVSSGATAQEIVTMIRQLYYPGTHADGLSIQESKFDRLLPDAPIRRPDGSRRILTPADTEPIFFHRLSQRAPENPTLERPLDNPSPMVIDLTGERVDLGHVLLTMDALLHPRADEPYSTYGVPAIDVASWVADVGLAALWAEQDGQPDAPIVLPRRQDGQVDIDGYIRMAAPDADLLGDIDGFNITHSRQPGTPLSQALRVYYFDGERPGNYRHRFRMFSDRFFGTKEPDSATLTMSMAQWTPRVDRFNDLYAGGMSSFFKFDPPPLRQWIYTSDTVAYFFQWLLNHLEVEANRFD